MCPSEIALLFAPEGAADEISVFFLLIFPTLCLQVYMEAADYSNKSLKPFLKGASYPNRSRWITEIAITEDLKKETISCADKAEAK